MLVMAIVTKYGAECLAASIEKSCPKFHRGRDGSRRKTKSQFKAK